ncbi:NUDIX domain-containing protein [Streptomyces sp. NPDC017529]|uniref:NUDIX domain-containing protein n=1 Tax=Streptomyces sp. NPDC017529 TaxID=3365000 RepID=UPI00379D35A1
MNTDTVAETIFYTVDVTCIRGRHFLAITRDWPPYEGDFALPGGYVDRGETALEAAVRELREETGVRITEGDLTLVGVYDDPGRDPRGRCISVAFVVLVPDSTTAQAGDDARAVQWVPLDGHSPLAFDHDRIVADARRKVAATKTDTFTVLSSCFSADLAALISEEAPQHITPSAFIDLVERARDALATASVGYLQEACEDLDAAVSHLTNALTSTEDEQRALLARARTHLRDALEATR